MKRRVVFLIFLALGICALASAQSGPDTVLAGGVGDVVVLEYDKKIGDDFSVAIDAYAGVYIGAEIIGRFYPWSGAFFTQLGAGYNHAVIGEHGGPSLAPGLGWKVDPDEAGGFVFIPTIEIPVIYFLDESKIAPGFIVKLLFGLSF